ncbi:MAG: hypothetical protein QOE94_3660 [Mycobacterium sp.]|nr:hypothetical protein [Mycobacterium sp.]MDT7722649.1 hypothetical protein [Mycobacterium sp.]
MVIPDQTITGVSGLGANAPWVLRRTAERIPDQLRFSANADATPVRRLPPIVGGQRSAGPQRDRPSWPLRRRRRTLLGPGRVSSSRPGSTRREQDCAKRSASCGGPTWNRHTMKAGHGTWACRLLGHRPSFRADGRTLRWECARGCGQVSRSKQYATPQEANRYAVVFDRRDTADAVKHAPMIGLLPLRLCRRLHPPRRKCR